MEHQVNHKIQSFQVKVVHLVPKVQTLARHAVGNIGLAPKTTLHFDIVHKTKYHPHIGLFIFLSNKVRHN